LKSEAPLFIPTNKNKLAKRIWPTPNPPGDMGIAVAINPIGIN